MLDIQYLRKEADEAKRRLRGRSEAFAGLVDEALAYDGERRRCETEKQTLQQDRNAASKEIGHQRKQGQDTAEAEGRVRGIGERIAELDAESAKAEENQRAILLSIPNLPHEACPVGADAEANPEVRIWGEKPSFDFTPKDHVDLASALGLLDFEAATTLSGSGYVVFTGDGARLERSLLNFLLDLHTREHGYREISPPFLVRRECMIGTGQLPKFEDDMYGLENGALFLAPTAEVPVTNLVRDTIQAEDQLPLRFCAYTPCFRREAGSAGRDSRGLIRMHQFDKVELVQVTHPDQSFATLEALTNQAEKVLQLLGLHYRVIELCTGDLGFSSAKTYDIEVWAPGQGRYLEVSSCSNFTDYQARRMNLRFKETESKKNRFCHTLNGSGTALPRLYVALLETYQRPDGSIAIPTALQPYFGAAAIAASAS